MKWQLWIIHEGFLRNCVSHPWNLATAPFAPLEVVVLVRGATKKISFRTSIGRFARSNPDDARSICGWKTNLNLDFTFHSNSCLGFLWVPNTFRHFKWLSGPGQDPGRTATGPFPFHVQKKIPCSDAANKTPCNVAYFHQGEQWRLQLTTMSGSE